MSGTDAGRLLPDGSEVRFVDIGRTLQQGAAVHAEAQALTATVVVIGPHPRLVEAAGALEHTAGVRTILISAGENPAPAARIFGQAVALEGLRPAYIDNAVGALRLSSLPTLVWWRGGTPGALRQLATLADRLVLDEEDPTSTWSALDALTERTAVSDLRWTRLTRWRALTAHFFDIADVRAAGRFERLVVSGGDVHAGRLFAGWLASALAWDGQVSIDIRAVAGGATIESVRLSGGPVDLELALAPGQGCVRTVARIRGRECAARTVALGNGGLPALIAEELRVRSRDLAFERAVAALAGVS